MLRGIACVAPLRPSAQRIVALSPAVELPGSPEAVYGDRVLDIFAQANMMGDVARSRVLFLCTGNSCRSQMAEGWLRHLAGDRLDSFSAGSRPAGFVHPMAVRAMAEAGVDISGHRSKSLDEFAGQDFTLLVTVCNGAREACPSFAGAKRRLHWGFDDPASAEGGEEERMAVFRRVRDEIAVRIRQFLASSDPEKNG